MWELDIDTTDRPTRQNRVWVKSDDGIVVQINIVSLRYLVNIFFAIPWHVGAKHEVETQCLQHVLNDWKRRIYSRRHDNWERSVARIHPLSIIAVASFINMD